MIYQDYEDALLALERIATQSGLTDRTRSKYKAGNQQVKRACNSTTDSSYTLIAHYKVIQCKARQLQKAIAENEKEKALIAELHKNVANKICEKKKMQFWC